MSWVVDDIDPQRAPIQRNGYWLQVCNTDFSVNLTCQPHVNSSQQRHPISTGLQRAQVYQLTVVLYAYGLIHDDRRSLCQCQECCSQHQCEPAQQVCWNTWPFELIKDDDAPDSGHQQPTLQHDKLNDPFIGARNSSASNDSATTRKHAYSRMAAGLRRVATPGRWGRRRQRPNAQLPGSKGHSLQSTNEKHLTWDSTNISHLNHPYAWLAPCRYCSTFTKIPDEPRRNAPQCGSLHAVVAG